MRPIFRATLALIVLAALAAAPAEARMFSKRYLFKPEVRLEIGAALDGGLRVDTVQFTRPDAPQGRRSRTRDRVQAEVAISNSSDESRRVGIAIALFDEQGRLVAVASGGSRLLPIKPDRQTIYTLVFDDVNSEIHRTSAFQISVEPR